MLYTEDFTMRHYVGFSQIGSHIWWIIETSCIAILYCIVTTQRLDTDTVYLRYRTSLIFSENMLCESFM